MCFSAPASFIASGGLAVLGSISLMRAKGRDVIIAAIPFLFAIQQGFEGVQWLHLEAGTISAFAGYGFLIFAFVVWPLYVPIALYVLDVQRRKVLLWFIVIGAIVALYFILRIPTQPLYVEEISSCISYSFYFPFGSWVSTLYMTAVFGPLLLSSRIIFKWFGVVVVFLAMIAWAFFTVQFISVWCFFAAAVSSMFFVYIVYSDEPEQRTLFEPAVVE